MRRLKTFLRWPKSQRRLIVTAWFYVWLACLGLKFISFPKLQKIFGKLVRLPLLPRCSGTPNEMADAVRKVSRCVPAATCLVQALSLHSLLKMADSPSTIHFGVAKSVAGVFDAHAWVECNSEVILGGENSASYSLLHSTS